MNLKPSSTKTAWRLLGIETIAVSLLVITGASINAALNAQAVSAAVNTQAGTLSLVFDTGYFGTSASAGFSTAISKLAPGDMVRRYVDLNNSGNIDGKDVDLKVATSGGDNAILAGTSAKALTITVDACSVAWSSTGTCSGSSSALLTSRPVGNLSTEALLTGLSSFTAGAVEHLKISIGLPDQYEMSTNGVPDSPSTTIQDKSAHLTFTFHEVQRDSVASDS